MAAPDACVTDLLSGSLVASAFDWPLVLQARLGDLRSRFIAKGRAGRGYRAVARNGRVLLATEQPLPELIGQIVRLRLQTWHRVLLAGERPEPRGVLVCVRSQRHDPSARIYAVEIAPVSGETGELVVAVGGGNALLCRLSRH